MTRIGFPDAPQGYLRRGLACLARGGVYVAYGFTDSAKPGAISVASVRHARARARACTHTHTGPIRRHQRSVGHMRAHTHTDRQARPGAISIASICPPYSRARTKRPAYSHAHAHAHAHAHTRAHARTHTAGGVAAGADRAAAGCVVLLRRQAGTRTRTHDRTHAHTQTHTRARARTVLGTVRAPPLSRTDSARAAKWARRTGRVLGDEEIEKRLG